LLLDEPLANWMLKRECSWKGNHPYLGGRKGRLYLTNNIDEAIYLGDRIVILEGKLPGEFLEYKVNLPRLANIPISNS